MDSTGSISLLTDSSDRVHDLSGYFAKILRDNRFWTYFKLIKSPADGHCLIHSIVTALIFLNHNIQDHCTLFDKLKWECDNHHAKYLPDFIGTFDDFHYQMNQYIYNGVYDTGFCDLIPSILCNILKTTIVIIDKEICDYNVYVIYPFDKVPSDEALESFIDVSRPIILHRSGDHYDACVTVKSFENVFEITDNPEMHENMFFRTVKSGLDPVSSGDETIYEKPLHVADTALRIETENSVRITDATICFEPPGISGDLCYSLCDGHADVASSGADTTFIANDVENKLPLKDMKQFKSKHPKNLIVSHYNVNSIRHKIYEILPLLHEHLVDILAIAETKIDDSFPSDQFHMPNYKLYRQDRNCHGGGIMLYINDSIPHRILKEYSGEFEGIDFMTLEMAVKSCKWILVYIYKPPRVNDVTFSGFMSKLCEYFLIGDNTCVFFGDMNCNLLGPNVLSDTCDIFGLTNLVTGATCFKSETPSLVDVLITNKPKCFSGRVNIDFGCSDFHNLIAVASRMYAPEMPTRKITYRSMKRFSDESFLEHIESVPFHVSETFDDIDDIHWAQNNLLMSVINHHAPLKTKYVKGKNLPYMNSELRKAINQRNMWRNRHFKNRQCTATRKKYTTLRNRVVKLQRKSVQHYFDQKC